MTLRHYSIHETPQPTVLVAVLSSVPGLADDNVLTTLSRSVTARRHALAQAPRSLVEKAVDALGRLGMWFHAAACLPVTVQMTPINDNAPTEAALIAHDLRCAMLVAIDRANLTPQSIGLTALQQADLLSAMGSPVHARIRGELSRRSIVPGIRL